MAQALKNGTLLKGRLEYRIERCLGQGGFGITYLATGEMTTQNISHRLYFTIKEFYMEASCVRLPDGSVEVKSGCEDSVAAHQKEFLSEAERLHKLEKHPGIVPVNEVFRRGGTIYYVMEYLGSTNLVRFIEERGGKLGEAEALPLARRIASALQFLHERKITHLDVKPDNIMVRDAELSEPQPVLIDFGLAVHYGRKGDPTREQTSICCSDGYSPLEQYMGIQKFSPEADVYALCATICYMLTGETPPRANELTAEYFDTVLPADLSTAFREALRTGMAKLAEQRFPTVAALLSALPSDGEAAPAAEEGGHTRVIGAPSRSKKVHRKPSVPSTPAIGKALKAVPWKKLGMGAGCVLLVAILALAGLHFAASLSQDKEDTALADTSAAAQPADSTALAASGTATEASAATPVQEKTAPEPAAAPHAADAAPQTASVGTPAAETPAPAAETSTSTTLSLGYATYSGDVKDGKPHGRGTLTFSASHQIDSNDREGRTAGAGDVVTGAFYNGHLTSGVWRKADGTKERLNFGN